MEKCSEQFFVDEKDLLMICSDEEQEQSQKQQIIDKKIKKQYHNNPKVDTNIIAIRFDILKENEKNIMLGDPIYCKKCFALLNFKSQVMNSKDYKALLQQPKQYQCDIIQEENENQQLQQQQPQLQKQEENPQQLKLQEANEHQQQQSAFKQEANQVSVIQQQKINLEDLIEEEKKDPNENQKNKFIYLKNDDELINELNEKDRVWVCEFCGTSNKVQLEDEEIPKNQDVIYMVQSANQMQEEKNSDDISVIMCIDNSGSMASTSEVQGVINFKHGITEEEYNMLKQFIDPGDENQIFPGFQNQNKTWISRKQCVIAAIESQLQDMKKSNPQRKVGLVTFNNEVFVIGDGISKESFTIAGDKLYKYDEIMQLCQQKANVVLSAPIKESVESLLNLFAKLEEKGQTALGPALLASISLASQGKAGSMVIICTDGIANIGLGSLEGDDKQSQEFYDKLSFFAKQVGIVVSVITLKGEECNLKVLGKIAEETNGSVTRVNPENISKDFQNILKDEIVATNVELQVKLHQAMQFRNEDPNEIFEEGTILKKQLGNATINTKITFEYEIKKAKALKKLKIDLKKLKEIPLQAIITYKSLLGHKMIRVITQDQKVSFNKEEVEKQAKVDVMHALIAQKSANLIQKGKFLEAKQYNNAWEQYVDNSQHLNFNEDNFKQNQSFKQKNKILKKAANKKEKRLKQNKLIQFINMEEPENMEKQQQADQPDLLQNQQQQKVDSNEQLKDEMPIKEENEQEEVSKLKLSACFSEGSGGYSSDDDKDEMFFINYKQGKID